MGLPARVGRAERSPGMDFRGLHKPVARSYLPGRKPQASDLADPSGRLYSAARAGRQAALAIGGKDRRSGRPGAASGRAGWGDRRGDPRDKHRQPLCGSGCPWRIRVAD